jgi:protein kinase A
MLKKAEIVKSKQVDHVLNENHILNQLNHPFIVLLGSTQVNMEGFAQDQRYLYFML